MPLIKEAYLSALNSPTITLIINDTGKKIPCPLAFLALHSGYFAKVLSKTGILEDGRGELQLERVSQSSVETFVHWCHKEQPLALEWKEGATKVEQTKDTLIDLWIFTDEYIHPSPKSPPITKQPTTLPPDTTSAASKTKQRPASPPSSEPTPSDIQTIFSRTLSHHSPLRRLAITVLVAQLHSPGPTPLANIEDFDELLFKGAMSLFYRAMRNWTNFGNKYTGPEGDILLGLLCTVGLFKMWKVQEDEPEGWVFPLCGLGPKGEKSGMVGEPIEVD